MVITEEEWRDVPDYEGYYQVSNLGNVRSCDRMYLKSTPDGKPVYRLFHGKKLVSYATKGRKYLQVGLCRDGKMVNVPVHQIVAKTFLPNPNRYSKVKHLDGDCTNNAVSNLEWDTSSSVEVSHENVYPDKYILEETSRKLFCTFSEASQETGASIDEIMHSINEKRPTTLGLQFVVLAKV